MNPQVLLALGAACLEFLLTVHHRGPESLRLIREVHHRRTLAAAGPLAGKMDLGWSVEEDRHRWAPSLSLSGRLGPGTWGGSSSLDWSPDPEGGISWGTARVEGWIRLPVFPGSATLRASQEIYEVARLDAGLVMDRNRVVIQALEAYGTWESALERLEVWRRRLEYRTWVAGQSRSDPASADPGVLLDLDAAVEEAEFRVESEKIQTSSAEALCRALAGGGPVAPPGLRDWRNFGVLPVFLPGGTALSLQGLRAALDRDTAYQSDAGAGKGPGITVWVRAAAGGFLSRDPQGWKWNSPPEGASQTLQAGANLAIPLDELPSGREEELRILIYQGEETAVSRDLEARLHRIEVQRKEIEVLESRLASLENLASRSQGLLTAGEISRDDHERVLMRREDLLLQRGEACRRANLEILVLRSISGSLGSWLQKEADYESTVCYP